MNDIDIWKVCDRCEDDWCLDCLEDDVLYCHGCDPVDWFDVHGPE